MTEATGITVGMDLGDRFSRICVLDAAGDVMEEIRIRTTAEAIDKKFASLSPGRVALEVGTHSPWVSRRVSAQGHEVLVANARAVRAIYENKRKNDRVDAEMLARIARVDPKLLKPIQHRSEAGQAALAVIHSRDIMVRTRTMLINHVRGVVKAVGGRIRGCSAPAFHRQAADQVPDILRSTVEPILSQIASLTDQIRAYDRQIEELAETRFPETVALRQIRGVGALTALTFVLVLQDPSRFARSRQVGAYLGLVPGQDQTGGSDPQCRITRAGDPLLRRLLVNAAHYILGPFGTDSDLRRHGERISARGGANAKKRAAVAVARKLSVLMHCLWRTGEEYVPLRNSEAIAA